MQRSDRILRLSELLPAATASLVRAWGGAWGAIAIAALVWSARPLIPEAWASAGAIAWPVLALASTLVLVGALSRIAISDSLEGARRLGLGKAGVQFGRLELRIFGAAILCGVFLAMILSVISLLMLAVFGMAELDAEAIKARDWAAVGPVWKLVLLGMVTLGMVYAVAVLVVRLSLFAPATAGRGHMVSLNSMGIVQGQFWPLFAGLALASLPVLVLLVLSGAGVVAGTQAWLVWGLTLNGIQIPLTLCCLGAAYRRLEYWSIEGVTHS